MNPRSMRLTSVNWASTTLAGCLILACLGCQRTANKQHKELHLYFQENLKTIDPANADDQFSSVAVSQIYETPMQYRYESDRIDEVEPLLLANEPQVSADGLEVILTFRKNIRYQDDAAFQGKPASAREFRNSDFRLSIYRLLDPATKSSGQWLFGNHLQGDEDFLKATKETPFTNWQERLQLYEQHPIRGIQLLDDSRIKLQLRAPYPQLPYVLCMANLAPISPVVLAHYGEEIGQHPVGTGPYEMHEWQKGVRLTLSRNPDYWGKKPAIATVSFDIIIESQPQWLKFLNGELDTIIIPKDNFDTLIKDGKLVPEYAQKGIQLLTAAKPTIWFLGFNMQDPVVGNDPNLRAAIAYAYDFDKRIALLMNNRTERATSILPPGIPGYAETRQPPLQRDIEKAKALLAQSAYAKKTHPPVISYDLRGQSNSQRQLGELFKRDMAELGIKTKIQLNSFPEYIDKEKAGRLQVFLGGWMGDYPDAENFLQLLYGPLKPPGPNSTSYNNPEYNRLFELLQKTYDPVARTPIIKEMVAIVNRDMPWVADFYSTRWDVVQPWLKNYRLHPFSHNYVKYLRLE